MKSQPSNYNLRNRTDSSDNQLNQQQQQQQEPSEQQQQQQQQQQQIQIQHQSETQQPDLAEQHADSQQQLDTQEQQESEDQQQLLRELQQQATSASETVQPLDTVNREIPTEEVSVNPENIVTTEPTSDRSVQQQRFSGQQNSDRTQLFPLHHHRPSKMSTGVKLKKFDGTDNVHIWLANFEDWQKFHNETDAQALLAVGCNLDGQAATWYHTLSNREKTNMQLFKQCLRDRFAPSEATFSLMSIKQNTGESTDAYLARAEKMALGHNLTEVYKVQFIVNGLNNCIKSRIIGKKPQTFQALREAVALAKAELDCMESNPISEITLKAFATELKESLRQELCSLSTFNNIQTDSRQNKRQYKKNGNQQQQWQQAPQQQWQQAPQQQ